MRPSLRACPLLVALVASAGEAVAQPTSTGANTALQVWMGNASQVEGKRLLGVGKRLLEDDHPQSAAYALEASLRYDTTPEALLALAQCQDALGTTASAWGTLHRAEDLARTLGQTALMVEAAKRGAALEPRLSRVRVVVTATGEGTEVKIDDRWVVARDAWGSPLPLDRGQHGLTASWPGKSTFSTTFDLTAEGETKEVRVPQLAPISVPGVVSRPWTSKDRVTMAGLVLGIISGSHLGVALGIVEGGHQTDATLITAATFGGVGVLAGCAAVTLLSIGTRMPQTVRAPLPLQVGPMVARSGGGLTLNGVF